MIRAAYVAFLVAGGALLFAVAVRPWYLTWGASRAEAVRPLPGDDLVPSPKLASTRAIVIHAPVGQVWPWLLQLGYERAGWYNHDWINVLLGARYYEGRRSSSRILPQFQGLKVRDLVPLAPGVAWEVVGLQEKRLIILSARVDLQTGETWGPEAAQPAKYLCGTQVYALEELDDRTTRFIVRDRVDFEMGWPGVLARALEPGYFIQESAFMRGVKKRAEMLARAARNT